MFRKNKVPKSHIRKRVILFLLALVFGFGLFQGILNYGMNVLSYVIFPVQKKIYEVGNYFKETSDAIVKYRAHLEENRMLKNENVKYEMVVAYNKELLEENKRLKEILKIKESKKINLVVARVNFRNPNNLYKRFFIDLGRKDGMKKNMIVLSGETLIGKIGKVYDDYSVIDMITGENFNVSAVTENNMLGIIKGNDTEEGSLYFEPNTFQDTINVGEKVYTSGISDIYPKGLYIGEIVEIDDTEGEIFRSIKVENKVDVLNLMEVLILVPEK